MRGEAVRRHWKALFVVVVVIVLSITTALEVESEETQPLIVQPAGWGDNACQGNCSVEFYTASGGVLTGGWISSSNTTAQLFHSTSSGLTVPPGRAWEGGQNVTADWISVTISPGTYTLVWTVQGHAQLAAVRGTDEMIVTPPSWWWV